MFGTTADHQLSQVLAVLVLDESGGRIAQYYSPVTRRLEMFSTEEFQRKFETSLVNKARKFGFRELHAEVMTWGEYPILYRSLGDASLVVVGDPATNELLLSQFEETLYDVLTSTISDKLNGGVLLKRLDQVYLTFDEMLEAGCINELDRRAIMNRISMVE